MGANYRGGPSRTSVTQAAHTRSPAGPSSHSSAKGLLIEKQRSGRVQIRDAQGASTARNGNANTVGGRSHYKQGSKESQRLSQFTDNYSGKEGQIRLNSGSQISRNGSFKDDRFDDTQHRKKFIVGSRLDMPSETVTNTDRSQSKHTYIESVENLDKEESSARRSLFDQRNPNKKVSFKKDSLELPGSRMKQRLRKNV